MLVFRCEGGGLRREEGALDDYYSGADGASRLVTELDEFLQRAVELVDAAEALTCNIQLELTKGEVISLKKTYKPGREPSSSR